MNENDETINYDSKVPDSTEEFPFPLEPDFNLESKRARKLAHRIHLYGFVEKGGIGLVVVGCSYLSLLALWSWCHTVRRKSEK